MNKKDLTLFGVILLLSVILSIFIVCTPNPFFDIPISNDWIGYYGSIMGTATSGLLTLYVMGKSIESGRKDLDKSISENNRIQARNEKISFRNNIADLIGEYCSDISVYYYECIRAEHYDNDKRILYDRFYRCEITEEQYNHALDILELNRPRGDRRKSTAIYFKLEILLKEEESAKLLMETLKKVHNTYDYIRSRFDSDKNEFENEIENLLEETRKFIKEYKSNT